MSDDLPDIETLFSPAFWDGRYAGVDRTWSGRPNQRLVEVVSDLAPGRALDLGAGEGGDAAWLAERGWEVVAVDVSQVAVDRAEATVGSARVTWRQADLRTWTPEPDLGTVDLATMAYLHLPLPHQQRLLGLLAAVVRPGGTLVHIGHHADDIAIGRWDMAELMRPAAEIAADLDPAHWDVVRADDPTRLEAGPAGPGPDVDHGHGHGHGGADHGHGHGHGHGDGDGGAVQVRDTVVVARRR